MNFLSISAFMNEAVRSSLPESIAAQLRDQAKTDAFAIGMRPEHLDLCNASEARLKGKLRHLEALGAETLLHLTLDSGEHLTIRHYGNVSSPRLGDDCFVTCNDDDLCLFDAEGRCLVPALSEPWPEPIRRDP